MERGGSVRGRGLIRLVELVDRREKVLVTVGLFASGEMVGLVVFNLMMTFVDLDDMR